MSNPFLQKAQDNAGAKDLQNFIRALPLGTRRARLTLTCLDPGCGRKWEKKLDMAGDPGGSSQAFEEIVTNARIHSTLHARQSEVRVDVEPLS